MLHHVVFFSHCLYPVCSGCSTVECQASAQADLLSSTSSSLASSLRQTTDESLQSLEEMNGCCSHLHSVVSGIKLMSFKVLFKL